MSDSSRPEDGTQPSGEPSQTQQQPNWGSAYPSPQQQGGGYPPPGGYPGYPPAGGYPPPPGYPQQYGPPPKHPNATTSMVLGIVAVAGGLMCWLPLFIAPFAWFMGSKALRDIRAGHGTQGGHGEALAGKVLGIIGSVLLVLGLAVVVLLVVLTFTVDDFWDDESTGGSGFDYYDTALIGLRMALLRS